MTSDATGRKGIMMIRKHGLKSFGTEART